MNSKFKKAIGKFLHSLNELQHLIFSCYIERDYFSKKYEYEEQIHQVKIQLFNHMKNIRLMNSNPDYLSLLENLYEIIFSLNTFKLRVTDHSTFEVCENELKVCMQCISNILKETEPTFNLNQLSSAIDNFEELYRSTLQVVSYEPIIFLYFVQNMMALRDALQVLIEDVINA